MVRLVLAALSAIVVACSSPSALPTDAATGLPILVELPAFPGSVGAMEWRETSEPAEGFRAGDTIHASIGDLVAAMRGLAAETGAATMVGFLGPPAAAEATLVFHTSSRDEAFAGEEMVAQVRRNERGWYVELIRFRHHCRREITETGECA